MSSIILDSQDDVFRPQSKYSEPVQGLFALRGASNSLGTGSSRDGNNLRASQAVKDLIPHIKVSTGHITKPCISISSYP